MNMWTPQNDCISQIGGLLDCYGQVQAATKFIANVLASTPTPLKGVTDGSNAQPGQVGEWVQFSFLSQPFTATSFSQLLALGTLTPGDWDVSVGLYASQAATLINLSQQSPTAGFNYPIDAQVSGSVADDVVISPPGRASLSTPALVTYLITINGAPAAGVFNITFTARRMR